MSFGIHNLDMTFGDVLLYRDFYIDFPEGKITCILGPSGCGKTTLLNIIGGLQKPDSGELVGFDDRVKSYIFQDPRLLPWKTVKGNVEFVISREDSEAERSKYVDQLLNLVELERFADYYPSKLSGGMRQRVSIARAFAYPSDIILMDEPLKGLDVVLKINMIKAFLQIWQAFQRTVIFVTHDVDEAIMLGDQILVFSKPPVEIAASERIELPKTKRVLNDPRLKELKQIFHQALKNKVNGER